MKYIADDIGQEYKEWIPGKSVFIASPTGSGKTTFIFETLLPYYASQNKRILYLVNRSVLKKQLEKRIDNLPFEYKGFIHVETYQAIEGAIIDEGKYYPTREYCNGYNQCIYDIKSMNNSNCAVPQQSNNIQAPSKKYLGWLASFDCAVCDECHYFLTDSNFNKHTILSYNFIRKFYGFKFTVFISATIKDIKQYIYDGKPLAYLNRTEWFGLSFYYFPEAGDTPKLYIGDRQYDYIDLNFIKHKHDVLDVISSDDNKL